MSRTPIWPAYLAALVLLGAVGSVQLALSMGGVGAPVDGVVLAARAGILMAAGAVAAPLLEAIHRRLDPSRAGWLVPLAAMLAVLAVAGALVAWVGLPLQGRLIGRPIVFRGSALAAAIGHTLTLAAALGIALGVDLLSRLRRREAEGARLEARLAEARLQALARQIHPHFLFNTLNAISVLVHRDPDGADAMLTRLAELLRATLRASAVEIPLREELALLERYLDIMRVRFGDRLAIRVAADADVADALVPPFLLQPLVENALEHGIGRRAGPGEVRVSAAATGERLRLIVADDGPGLGGRGRERIGLGATRQRLAELHAESAEVTLTEREGGGVAVVVELPLRRGAA